MQILLKARILRDESLRPSKSEFKTYKPQVILVHIMYVLRLNNYLPNISSIGTLPADLFGVIGHFT